MKTVDVAQNTQIRSISKAVTALEVTIAIFIGLGGLAAFLVYLEDRKHKKIKEDILVLDKNIKELTLRNLQNNK